MWIPKNKRTGTEYTPVTDAQKAEYLADPNLAKKYIFTEVKQKQAPAPEPIEAKRAEPKKELQTPAGA